jgi:Ion channel
MGDQRDTQGTQPGGEEAGVLVSRSGADPRAVRRYAWLLVAIVLAFGIQGIATPGRWEQLITTILLDATLLLALFVAEARPSLVRVTVLLVLASAVLSLVAALAGHVEDRSTRLANGLLVALAPPAIFVGVLRTLRAKQAVTVEAVLGVLCVYILLGMFFAFVYGSVNALGGSPFFVQGPATTANCIYFSFTTLATVGYGDFTARTSLGHTLSVSEALLGQVYLVTIVSLIVANLGRRRGRSS